MFRSRLEIVDSATSSDSAEDDDVDGDVTDQVLTQTSISASTTGTSRTKRQIAWCGVDNSEEKEEAPSTSLSSYTDGVKLQLFSQTGYFLGIYPDGRVRGTQDKNDLHTMLEMITTGFPGHVIIRGTLTNLYLAMTAKGRLRAQGHRQADRAVFIEGVLGFYVTYLNRHFAHNGWYIGIKKSGKFKNGLKTKLNQKAVHFVKRYR